MSDDLIKAELIDSLAGMLVLQQLIGVSENDLSIELMAALRKRAERAQDVLRRARGEETWFDPVALLAERDKLRAEVERLNDKLYQLHKDTPE